jgi:CRP/FNR family transcriptional regulator
VETVAFGETTTLLEIASIHGQRDSSENGPQRSSSPKPILATCNTCLLQKVCPLTSTSHIGTPLNEAIYEPDSIAFTENDHFDKIYVLKSGSIQISVTNPKGEQSILGFVFPGEMVGWESWKFSRFPYTIKMLERSRLCTLEKKNLLHSMRISPDFQVQLLRAAGQQVMRDRLSPLAMLHGSIEAKTAAFILDIYTRNHVNKHIAPDFILSMPRNSISSYIGITPESLSRSLSSLRKKGAISVFNRRISVLDKKLLHTLAID